MGNNKILSRFPAMILALLILPCSGCTDVVEEISSPGMVFYPSPPNTADNIELSVTLSWEPGWRVFGHNVYFGTDAQSVENANIFSPEFLCATRETACEAPFTLEYATTYYWRVDGENSEGINKGRIWSFTTIQPPGFTRTWGGYNSDTTHGVAVTPDGSVYCAGYTYFYQDTDVDAFLLKYNQSGELQWAKLWGKEEYDRVYAVAAGPDNCIYCAGQTYGYYDENEYYNYHSLLLKFDSSGSLLWSKTWDFDTYDTLNGIAVASDGSVYCAGNTAKHLSFYEFEYNALLLKYDSSGELQWARTWDLTDSDNLSGIAVDSDGDVYCAGWTGNGGLLLKYNSTGVLQWAKTLDETGLKRVALCPDGSVCCASDYSDSSTQSKAAILLNYNSSGTLRWARTWDSAGSDYINSLAVDVYGNICCAGSIYSSHSGNNQNALVLKCDSSGIVQWAREWDCPEYDIAYGVAVDTEGDIFVGGFVSSADGRWHAVVGALQYEPIMTEGTVVGTEGSPVGVEGSPAGKLRDMTWFEPGAGDRDAVLFKFEN